MQSKHSRMQQQQQQQQQQLQQQHHQQQQSTQQQQSQQQLSQDQTGISFLLLNSSRDQIFVYSNFFYERSTTLGYSSAEQVSESIESNDESNCLAGASRCEEEEEERSLLERSQEQQRIQKQLHHRQRQHPNLLTQPSSSLLQSFPRIYKPKEPCNSKQHPTKVAQSTGTIISSKNAPLSRQCDARNQEVKLPSLDSQVKHEGDKKNKQPYNLRKRQLTDTQLLMKRKSRKTPPHKQTTNYSNSSNINNEDYELEIIGEHQFQLIKKISKKCGKSASQKKAATVAAAAAANGAVATSTPVNPSGFSSLNPIKRQTFYFEGEFIRHIKVFDLKLVDKQEEQEEDQNDSES